MNSPSAFPFASRERRRRGDAIGDYVVEKMLADKHRSAVYLCHKRGADESAQVKYALKALKWTPFTPTVFGACKRFFQTRALKSLNHPNVLKVHDLFMRADGFYLATEYFDGAFLSDFINAGAPFKEADIKRFARALLAAFSYIEARAGRRMLLADFEHRNVLVGLNGAPCIIDIEPKNLLGRKATLAVLTDYLLRLLRLNDSSVVVDNRCIAIIGACALKMASAPLPDSETHWLLDKEQTAELERRALAGGYDGDLIGLAVASVADPSAVAFADWERILA